MSNESKITTALEVDDPVEQDTDFIFDADERQRLDNQVRGVQKHVVSALITNANASFFWLDGASAAIAPGDVFCATTVSSPRGTVVKAVPAALANVVAATGVALTAGAPGSRFIGALSGMISPLVTNLPATKGFARVKIDGRCEYVAALTSSDFAVGAVDPAGWLTIGGTGTAFAAAMSAATGGWKTVLDLDFTDASTQNLDTPGTYVIGGKNWKSEPNSFGRGQVDLVHGTGLVMQTITASSGYGPLIGNSNVKNAPLIWMPLSEIAIPNLDWTTELRIWISVSNQTITNGFAGNTGIIWGIDNDPTQGTNDTNWYALVAARSASTTTQTQLRAAIGVGDWSATSATADITGYNAGYTSALGTCRLDLASLLPDSEPCVHFGAGYSGGWPTIVVPWVKARQGATQRGRTDQIGWANDPATPAAIGDRLGIVLAVANDGAFAHPDTATITRMRVDYKS